MIEPNYRALCAKLVDELEDFQESLVEVGAGWYNPGTKALIDSARAALAHPEPMAPTDEELLKLLSGVSGLPDCDTYIVDGGRIMSEPNELLAYARSVLARWGTHANNTGVTH